MNSEGNPIERAMTALGNPPTLEEVFSNYKGRREGIIKALTSEFTELSLKCNPEKGPLYLYAFPDESWKVTSASSFEMSDYAIGAVFPRDATPQDEWVLFEAYRCDPWLSSLSFYLAPLFAKHQRKQLFRMITDMPTVADEVAKFWKIEPRRIDAIATKYREAMQEKLNQTPTALKETKQNQQAREMQNNLASTFESSMKLEETLLQSIRKETK